MTPVRPKYESIEDIFDEIAREAGGDTPPRSANATVRPLPTPGKAADGVPSGKLDDSDIIDIIAEESSRMAPLPRVSDLNVVVPAKDRDLAATLRATREIVGFSLETASGAVTHEGICDDRLHGRIVYFAHLGALVGKDLGLDRLRELHLVGENRRVALLVARDGSKTTVVADAGYETQALARWVGK